MIASIPSPPSEFLNLGPLSIRWYGLCIALGILAAYTLANRRWVARGGDPDDIGTIAIWAVPAGLMGARFYHVLTDWNRLYSDGRWWPDAFMFWKPGLGIPGGILLGTLVGVFVARRLGVSVAGAMDAAAPAIPIAQAIGRFGNYFNQELYGRPTDLPWGLEIDPEHRPSEYFDVATFHPTFLYEATWNVGVAVLIILLDRRVNWARGKLFALYVMLYGVGRLWVEALRIDTATTIGPFRVNTWMSLLIIAGGLFFLLKGGLASPEGVDRHSTRPDGRPTAGVDAAATDETATGEADEDGGAASVESEVAAAIAEDGADPSDQADQDTGA